MLKKKDDGIKSAERVGRDRIVKVTVKRWRSLRSLDGGVEGLVWFEN